MPHSIDAIAYNSTVCKVFINQLQVEADGGTWFVSRFSEPRMPVRALGVFHTTFPAEDPIFRAAFSFAESRGLAQLEPEPPRRPVPPPKSILLSSGGTTKAFPSNPMGMFGNPFAELEACLEQIIAQVGHYPAAGLTISIGLEPRDIRPGDSCRVQFEFRNIAQSAVRYLNPRYHSDDAAGEIVLEIWQQGNAPNITGDLVFKLSTHACELLTAPRRAIPSGLDVLQLEPQASLAVSCEFTLPRLAPGNYVARAIYSSKRAQPQKALITGIYSTDTVLCKILPVPS